MPSDFDPIFPDSNDDDGGNQLLSVYPIDLTHYYDVNELPTDAVVTLAFLEFPNGIVRSTMDVRTEHETTEIVGYRALVAYLGSYTEGSQQKGHVIRAWSNDPTPAIRNFRLPNGWVCLTPAGGHLRRRKVKPGLT